MAPILVMGLGNVILRDEGLGVRALQRLLERYALPEEVEAIDAGALGLSLLSFLDGVEDVLIIDAVHSGRRSGTLVRLEGEEIARAEAMHLLPPDVRLQELIALHGMAGSSPQRLVLWGMEPEISEPGLELTPECEAQLDALVDAVVQELRSWGVDVRPLQECQTG
ncbi:MAG: HyaD/HybD family hydrogenase maturation endopeptidase [Roseiflexaceae bacterium]|nr:HyaD/HybD family hydrogenase maturation endopeptidase [Roseiflexus sp.]MDW8213187.1 HyaD/HybD family hydrogenase maturation endopeptidase [Roseiflexaceae bacterium]